MRILVFGDSITQGFHDTDMGGWANRLHVYAMQETLKNEFERNKELEVFNQGISADTVPRLVERFEHEFRARWRTEKGKTLTIFAYGINDSITDSDGNHRTPLPEFKKMYAECIVKAKETGSVVLLGPGPIDEGVLNPIPWLPTHSYREASRVAFENAVRELADAYGCTFIPMGDVWGDAIAEHTTDGIHPNAEGHRLMFERVKEALETEGLL